MDLKLSKYGYGVWAPFPLSMDHNILPQFKLGLAMPPEKKVDGLSRLRESVTLDWSPFLPSNALNSNRQGGKAWPA